jgi:hypothetical protein
MSEELKALYSGGPIEAIVFKPIYPPKHDHDDLTYLGGYPIMSKMLAWPTGARSGHPLPFVGQVDLSKLPQVPQRAALPATGLLHFFAYVEDGDQGSVLYSEKDAELIETRSPSHEHQVPLYTDDCSRRPAFQRLDAYTKWWMEPIACPTYPSADDESADQELTNASFNSVFALPKPEDQLRPRVRGGRPEKEIWVPDTRFPYLWMCIELWASRFLVNRDLKQHVQALFEDKGAAITRECLRWLSRARTQGRFRRTEAAEVSEFWGWLRLINERSACPPYDGISERGLRLASGSGTSTDLSEMESLLRLPEFKKQHFQELPEKVMKIIKGELNAGEASKFLQWLEDLPHYRRLTRIINNTTEEALELSIELALAQDPIVAGAIPPGAIEYSRHLHWPQPTRRHQMFGYPQMTYGPADGHTTANHLLMQFSTDECMMDWVWGDAGELYFWISDEDLRAGRFDRATSMIECG